MKLAEINERIQERLKALKLSESRASLLAGKSDAIRNIRRRSENVHSGTTSETIAALAPVLQCSESWLMEGVKTELDQFESALERPTSLAQLNETADGQPLMKLVETVVRETIRVAKIEYSEELRSALFPIVLQGLLDQKDEATLLPSNVLEKLRSEYKAASSVQILRFEPTRRTT
jgi:transcriptional regulator with XRE-family HTH domain